MYLTCVITNDTLNSSKLNLKRIFAEILSENIGSNKRIKGDNSNAISVSKYKGTIVKYQVYLKIYLSQGFPLKMQLDIFFLELLNAMKNILVKNNFFINPRKVKKIIDKFIINKY